MLYVKNEKTKPAPGVVRAAAANQEPWRAVVSIETLDIHRPLLRSLKKTNNSVGSSSTIRTTFSFLYKHSSFPSLHSSFIHLFSIYPFLRLVRSFIFLCFLFFFPSLLFWAFVLCFFFKVRWEMKLLFGCLPSQMFCFVVDLAVIMIVSFPFSSYSEGLNHGSEF